MITLRGTEYRLCLLDTNAVSELVKQPELLGRFLGWSLSTPPFFIPCFSVFTLLELRRTASVYRQFIERFGSLPCLFLKSHEQLLEDELHCYPDPAAVNPGLIGFVGQLAAEGDDLSTALTTLFENESIIDQERYWNAGQQGMVEGIRSLVSNFPPAADAYTRSEVRTFVQIAGYSQLVYRANAFAEEMARSGTAVDVDAFPSLKASLYTVFHKFYTDRSRVPSRSDAFDVIISTATPYVDAIFTENHQAEVLRKTKRLDDFIRDLSIYTLRDLRQVPPVSALLSVD